MNIIRNGKIKFFGMISGAIIILLLIAPALKLHAEAGRVRVGYFSMPGYQEISQGGNRGGYGYDYLQEIAKYTGWKYEFVDTTWDECLRMLEAGELDIVTYAKSSSEDVKRFGYSEYPMGTTSTILTVRSDRNDYYYNDFSNFNGMNIGVLTGSSADKEIKELFSSYGISTEVQYFDSDKELRQALESGTIDSIAAGNHRSLTNEKVIAAFDAKPFYMISQKGNTRIMEELNNAMEEIVLLDPYFEKELYARYFEENIAYRIAMTREEEAYINAHRKLRIAASPDSTAMCYFDGEEYTGIAIDSVKALADIVGFEIEYVKTESYKESLDMLREGKVDIVGDFYTNYGWAETNGVIITEPYLEVYYIEARIKGKETPPEDARVATCENFLFNTMYILKHHPEENIVYFATEKDCVEAVRKGQAEVTYLNQYTAGILMKEDKNLKLKTNQLYDTSHGLSVAVGEDNRILCSILNKAVSSLEPSEIKQITEKHTQEASERVSLPRYIYYNPLEFILIICAFFSVIVIALLYFIFVRRKYNKHIYDLAYRDKLTGLGNIYLFETLVEKRWLEYRGDNVFILSLDISHFSTINETYGRVVGDYTINYVGKKLNELYGEEGIVARSKVDNFLVFGIYDRDNKIEEWVEQIKKEIGVFPYQENEACKTDIYISYNFGVAMERCTRSTSIKNLIDHSELARKAAKRASSHLCYFNGEMEQQLQREKTIEDCMESALRDGEFQVYYQPKYCMLNNEIIGAEALVRWNNKDYGFMSPAEFIPIFENNGFIVELDFYVMEQVYKMLRERLDSGKNVVQVSINQSRIHFSQKNYIERLNELRTRYDISQNLIELELTESIFANMRDISEVVDKLKANGYYLSVDDFGSGYSSLNMLKEVPIDTLKIDKDFLSGEDENGRYQKVIRKVVELANDLNMNIVCEGVEREEQAKFLQSIGCMYAQGFLYAKPMTQEDFLRLLP